MLSVEDSEILRPATQLFHDLSQILRLCLPGKFDPKRPDLDYWRCSRAQGMHRISRGSMRICPEMQKRVRKSFLRILDAQLQG